MDREHPKKLRPLHFSIYVINISGRKVDPDLKKLVKVAFFKCLWHFSNQTKLNKVTWIINEQKTMFGLYKGWVWGVCQTIYECVICPYFFWGQCRKFLLILFLLLGSCSIHSLFHSWATKELKCKNWEILNHRTLKLMCVDLKKINALTPPCWDRDLKTLPQNRRHSQTCPFS